MSFESKLNWKFHWKTHIFLHMLRIIIRFSELLYRNILCWSYYECFCFGIHKMCKKILFSVSFDCLGRRRGDAEGNMCKLYKCVINYKTNRPPHIHCPNQWLFLVQASSVLSIKDEIFETHNTFCGLQWSVSKELNCLLIMICLYICIFKIIFKEL